MEDEQQPGSPSLPLAGKVALVTGSSRGIGRATALRLAQFGADIAVNYRNDAAGGEETRARVVALGRRAVAVAGDVGQEDDVARIFGTLKSSLGRFPFSSTTLAQRMTG